jgi:SagB-type dehydrogenase family enzyme
MLFWNLYHQSSKDRTLGHRPVPADSSKWPVEWKTVYYKTYPRLPKIPLPHELLEADLGTVLLSRSSGRNPSGEPLQLRQLALLLQYSAGISEGAVFQRRVYPSGGARFPLELYPIMFHSSDEIPSGVYHYDPLAHHLDSLWERSFTDEDIHNLCVDKEWIRKAAGIIVMTAVFDRTLNKYGERGYRYILQEAGHVGQNIYLVSQALGLQCCGLGSAQDTGIERVLDIDGEKESVVYALSIGV